MPEKKKNYDSNEYDLISKSYQDVLVGTRKEKSLETLSEYHE